MVALRAAGVNQTASWILFSHREPQAYSHTSCTLGGEKRGEGCFTAVRRLCVFTAAVKYGGGGRVVVHRFEKSIPPNWVSI